MESLLECVEVDPEGQIGASVIWLHGLGADGHDFEPMVPELGLPDDAGVRFVFPHAPLRAVTINNGITMRAWYDIYGFDRSSPMDETGIRDSQSRIDALVARENSRGVPSDRIVLAGFSQGGAIALQSGLRSRERFAGIMGLSTYLPLTESFESEASTANRRTPIFLAHGSADPVLPMAMGTACRDFLSGQGYAIEWHDYPMGHQVCLEEINQAAAWMRRVLSL